ncbi:glycosyltransferase family 2 protein [Thermodesulfobacteriota bacterium]
MSNNKSDPLVSIVLPTRNRASMIEECIKSCLNQTYRNIELIVVDESTDETPQILERLAINDKRIQVYQEACGNLPAALNYGFRWTRGDFLTWMCDDDIYEPDAIEIMVNELRGRPDIGLVYCDFKNIDNEGNVLNVEKRGDISEMDYKSVVGRCILYRRSVYAKIGDYSVDDWLNEDDEYWLRVRDHFQIYHIDASPYRYRLHDSTLTEVLRCEAIIAQHRTWAKRAKNSYQSRRIMGTGYLMASNLALFRRGKSIALRFAVKGFISNPFQIGLLKFGVKFFFPKKIIDALWKRKRHLK